MKAGWWFFGALTVAVGGVLLYVLRPRQRNGVAFHFVEEESALKNFGAFPPELPEHEFEGVNFLF